MMRLSLSAVLFCVAGAWAAEPACGPAALVLSPDASTLYIACADSQRVLWFDAAQRKVTRTVTVPGSAQGLALAANGTRLVVTCAAVRSRVVTLDAATGKTVANAAAGHNAVAPVIGADGGIFTAARFDDAVELPGAVRVPVTREPFSLALSVDGKWLFATNSMPAVRADGANVAAVVSAIDVVARKVAGDIALPNGSTGVRDIRISPDGRLAAVAHILSRYQLPATQLDRGWMATNALSLIDVAARKLKGTVLLDELDRGAANPWGVAWSGDGRRLAITHAGTHELSVVDVPALLTKLAAAKEEPANDLSFLVGLRERIPLASRGARSIAMSGTRAWIAGYFSDTVETIDIAAVRPAPQLAARLSHAKPSQVRWGEELFNDGSLCFQGWQSCATCHSFDARVDGLNWDLLNDGIGNPKNAKSMLLAHRTPPAMSQGVRDSAETAVRSGLRVILFAQRPEEEAAAIDAYLKSLKPVPSPALVNGKLSAAAVRGRAVFQSAKTGCASCHPAGLFTDLKPYDVGTRAATDSVSEFDTPTLVEIWRTGPYLHDGSAATLREVVTTSNRGDKHGKTSQLSKREIEDLIEYLRSL